jgi:hypothetical protein
MGQGTLSDTVDNIKTLLDIYCLNCTQKKENLVHTLLTLNIRTYQTCVCLYQVPNVTCPFE